MKKVKLKEFLKQYKNKHMIQDDKTYGQVTISQTGEVFFRGEKHGTKIGRKRQFLIDLKNYPNTLIFIRQGVMKGGIGICPSEVNDCVVTENMPMFKIVDINPEYLINFIKSPVFKKEVNKLVPVGTAQKALHENKLLKIEIPYPSEKDQEKVVKKIQSMENEIKELEENFQKDQTFLIKLKQSILQEAVQGKLVKQNPKDESASELLKKIKKEKEKLIRGGKIKKGKDLPKIEEDEIPYGLPKGWVWCRLGDVCEYIQRGKSPKYSDIEEYPVIAQKCIQWKGFEMFKAKFIDPNTILKYGEERFVKTGDLLWNSTGLGTLGRIIIYDEKFNGYEKAVADSHVTIIRPTKKFAISKYLFSWFAGPIVQNEINDISTGSTKQTELATSTIREYLVPFPPLTEQKHIVAKVDKLMKFCEGLELEIKENKKSSELLMEAVLRESFE